MPSGYRKVDGTPVGLRHGYFGTPEYAAWGAMIQRCTNEKHPRWKYYGARGITVCRRWLESAASFIEDMGPRPSPRHTLDRINNDGHYEPANCRWATWQEQRANRSRA